jgi:pimeloyl-ACP methyl ester carboxylesterase
MTFGLVHGGAHGAWCWERVLVELDRLGHRGVAMDLPCDDDAAGAEAYADIVIDALAGVPEPVVLVGHSLGGLTLPLVATHRPTQRMIFLCAMLPVPGKSFRDQQAAEPILFPYQGGFDGLRDRFFHTCTPADADAAMTRLRRQSVTPFVETTPLADWPEVASNYVLCTADRACRPDWSRRAARERLGIDAVELAGSDHSPFLGRPAELTEIVVRLATGAVS